ncbi:unnamed protein product [Scytosiphon promiscuus]
MRRSCDACGRKKRRLRCDQLRSRCLQLRQKRWHHCKQHQHEQQRRPLQSDRDAVFSREDRSHSTSCTLMEHQIMPFKRYVTFRASPATGLVGMQENDFLSDFFGCVGFLPLANERCCRSFLSRQQFPITRICSREDTSNNVSGTSQLPEDPSLCIFWCAVAMGALAKGSPFDMVSPSRSGPRASAILAYLYSFLREAASFCEYLESSEYFLQASIEQGSTNVHSGLPDLILQCREAGNKHFGAMKPCLADRQGPPQVNTIATKADVYRFVTQSFRKTQEATYAKLFARWSGDLQDLSSCGSSRHQSCSIDPLAREMSDAIATA